MGNEEQIAIALLCHRHDAEVVAAAFHGVFDQCRLAPLRPNRLARLPPRDWATALFYDYFPPPPYSHLLTRPDELKLSPYESLLTTMATVPAPAVAVCQVLFQPAPAAHDWHRNVQIILDLEFAAKLGSSPHMPQRYAQQFPSGDLRQMAWDVEHKAHNDKPFYSAAFRVAMAGPDPAHMNLLRPLTAFANVFQHGGRPLERLTHEDYAQTLTTEQIRDMFLLGLTHRPGFLVNSWELTGLVHPPPASVLAGETSNG